MESMDAGKNRYHLRLQRAIEFIEENLKEELKLKEVSARAFASLYHFHRLFRALVGQSLKEYIRGRRLTQAARDLVTTDRSVTEIALDYRYSAPESFMRAFKGIFAMTPTEFRRQGVLPAVHEKADLLQRATRAKRPKGVGKGAYPMNPRVLTLEPFQVVGELIHTRHGSCHREITGLWSRLRRDEKIARLARQAGADSVFGICFGVCAGCSTGEPADKEAFPYIVGWQSAAKAARPRGFVEMKVPGGAYAVFPIRGGEKEILEAVDRIYGSWLPSSSCELSDSPLLEKYGLDWKEAKESLMEIWLPVRESGNE